MRDRRPSMTPLAAVAGGRSLYGLPFGVAVWTSDYIALPLIGLYKPIWEYDAKSLAWDLAGHLAYGAGTGAAFRLFSTIRNPPARRRTGRRHASRSPIRARIHGPRPL